MFRGLTEISRAIHDLSQAVQDVREWLENRPHEAPRHEAIEARLGELEGTLARREAEAEALRIEAEARFSAARSSEERTRRERQRTEDLIADAGDEEGTEEIPGFYRDLLRGSDGLGGQGEGVQPVPNGVGPVLSDVERQRQRKFGY